MAKKSLAKLVIYAIILVVLFFSLIAVVRDGKGMFLGLEVAGLLLLLLLTLIGFAGYNKAWGERVLFFVFLFYMINLILLWYFNNNLYLVLLFLSLIGFFMSFPKKVESYVEPVREPKPQPELEIKDVKKTVAKKHSPGKYVASSYSNIYHAPKCDWAKKIKKERQKWFTSKEEAWEEGYKAHSCVE